MKNPFSKILFFIGISFLFTACSVTKKIPEGEYYLKSNDYDFEGKSPFSDELDDYVSQKPNKKTFGVFPIKDWTYNEVPAIYDSVFGEYYEYSDYERSQTILDSLYVKYGVAQDIGRSRWFMRQLYRTGAKPVVLDTAKSQKSARELEAFYFERGYFDAKVNPEIKVDSTAKKAQVTFKVEAKEPSDIIEYNQVIENAHLEQLYAENLKDSRVKVNKRFDVRNFQEERDRLTNIFENNGYFQFNKLGQELIFKVDSTDDKSLKATLKIAKKSDSVQFKQYHLGDITINLQDFKKSVFDTVHRNYTLKSNKKFKLNPRVYTDAISIKSGDLYKKDELFTTRKLILDRENFTLVSLTAEENKEKDSLLDVNITLRPKDKYDLELSFEGMYSPLIKLGISPGVRLLTRNIFNGGENLEFNLRGTLGTVNNGGNRNNFFNAYELAFETKMTFPRWVLPFNTEELVPKEWNPKSSISLGLSGQRNIGLGSRNYVATMDYSWSPNIKSHKFELINFRYIRNTEKEKYYRIFTVDREIRDNTFTTYFNFKPTIGQAYENGEINNDDLEFLIYSDQEFANNLPQGSYTFDNYTDYRNAIFRKNNITQDAVIQAFSHTFTYNQNLKSNKRNPWYINTKAEVAGPLLRLLDATIGFKKENNFFGDRQALVGGVPYSEFVRFDLDVRKTIKLTKKSQLAFRSFTGIAVPYGNLEVLPFSKSYFGGGSNDVRAWRAYALSPAPLKPNDKGTYIDQMKITWNAEYRFPLTSMVNGALFVDAGNIWSLKTFNPRTQFKFNKFLSQLGVGSGFGLRFDFTFVVARFDFAYKIHDPAYKEGDRWFKNVKILRPQLQFGINYPF